VARAKRGFAQVTQQRSGRYAVRYTEAWAADKRRQIDRGAKAAREKITFSA
jgi:hypothetical protein